MPSKIVIVDQDITVTDQLQIVLHRAGFEVAVADNGASGLAKIQAEMPSLVILDLNLPQITGFGLCKLLKGNADTSRIPAIILTAQISEEDRILGFELGADDFIAKPFNPREIILRIRNSICRAEETRPIEEKMILGALALDRVRHEVTVYDKTVFLSLFEFKLLERLMARCGEVIGRDVLLQEVWGQNSSAFTRTIDTHMTRLRAKLGPLSQYIETVRKVGFRLSTGIYSSAERKRIRISGFTEVNAFQKAA
jgi:two-component system, OmpR family, phosphate regulon response regulator PhoB